MRILSGVKQNVNYRTGSAERTIFELIATWDEFKKTDWITEIEYPELTLQQTQDLLAIPV